MEEDNDCTHGFHHTTCGYCVLGIEEKHISKAEIRAKAFEDAADLILGASENLRDAATCRDIANELRDKAEKLRRHYKGNVE